MAGPAPDPLARAARRYLAVVKAALLDMHYLENEVRIEYLATLPPGAPPDVSGLRDPLRKLPIRYAGLLQARRAGRSTDHKGNISFFPYTDMGERQLDHLEETLTALRAEGVAGDLAEIGVGRGGGAIFLRAFLEAYEVPETRVWAIDRFLGTLPATDADASDAGASMARFAADLNQVFDGFARFDLYDDRVRILQGVPRDVLRDAPIERLALARFGGRPGTWFKGALQRDAAPS